MRNIYYRFGFGAFTNQDELYFVDFANFARHNLPVGWNDEIGGVFQVLDGRWYNSSRRYVRGHFTYEAPFLILRHLMKYTRYVPNVFISVHCLCRISSPIWNWGMVSVRISLMWEFSSAVKTGNSAG